MRAYNFAWIGDGQLARSLLPALLEAGHKRVQISELSPNVASCSLLFLAVSDDSLPTVVRQLQDKLHEATSCVHFSGSVPLKVLDPLHPRPCGVCYPLQSFATFLPADTLQLIPFFLEGNQQVVLNQLKDVIESLKASAQILSSQERKWLHLSAVIANNFSNHLLTQVQKQLRNTDLPFAVLRPLLEQTIKQAFTLGPTHTQSGPARRGDAHTVKEHEKMLNKEPFLLKIYQAFSQDIAQKY